MHNKTLTLVGVLWRRNAAYLRVRHGTDSSTLEKAIGFRFSYRTSETSKQHCVGTSQANQNGERRPEFFDCMSKPAADKKLCTGCLVAQARQANNLHHAHRRDFEALDGAAKRHLSQKNILYLAIFGDGSIKVGTSTQTRADTRLAEQGAWQAIQLASFDNGLDVREAEDIVTGELGVPQSVSTSRKIGGFISPLGGTELATRVQSKAEEVGKLIKSLPFDSQLVNEHWKFPAFTWPRETRILKYPSLASGAHSFRMRPVLNFNKLSFSETTLNSKQLKTPGGEMPKVTIFHNNH